MVSFSPLMYSSSLRVALDWLYPVARIHVSKARSSMAFFLFLVRFYNDDYQMGLISKVILSTISETNL